LLEFAVAHHGDARGERHRLDLIVRHIDDGGSEALMQFLDFRAHVYAQLRVQVGQRLVEQENPGLAHQRPPHGHSLALPARELSRSTLQEMIDLQRLRRPARRSRSPGPCAFPCRRRTALAHVRYSA
jgi:hypothetical protein